MRCIELFLPMAPIPQKRHRTARLKNGKGVRMYDPSYADKATIATFAYQVSRGNPLNGPVAVSVEWVFPRPKDHFRTGRFKGLLKPSAPMLHDKRPDEDNLTKILYDAVNGIIFHDDSQVAVVLKKIKRYANTREIPCVRATFWGDFTGEEQELGWLFRDIDVRAPRGIGDGGGKISIGGLDEPKNDGRLPGNT